MFNVTWAVSQLYSHKIQTALVLYVSYNSPVTVRIICIRLDREQQLTSKLLTQGCMTVKCKSLPSYIGWTLTSKLLTQGFMTVICKSLPSYIGWSLTSKLLSQGFMTVICKSLPSYIGWSLLVVCFALSCSLSIPLDRYRNVLDSDKYFEY